MAYLGNTPADRFAAYKYQDFTGGSGTSFTLDHPSTTNGLRVVINNVIQEPTEAYSVSGTALTLTGSVSTTDDFYVVFLEQAILTATHPATQALSATDGTFTGDVDINGNDLILDADADTKLYASTDDVVKMNIAGSEVFRFDSDGLKFNGDTAAANALDDYEEGTWTPVFTGVTTDPTCTYDKQFGYYTKIGRLVTITGRIRTDSASGGSGALRLSGLPYTANNLSDGFGVVSIGYATSWPASKAPSGGYININSTDIVLVRYNSDDPRNAFATGLLTGDLNTSANNNDLIFKASYYTA